MFQLGLNPDQLWRKHVRSQALLPKLHPGGGGGLVGRLIFQGGPCMGPEHRGFGLKAQDLSQWFMKPKRRALPNLPHRSKPLNGCGSKLNQQG